ncbi:MAG: RidA family protein [Burkholderiales bacterium]|nr:RidA family protein [Burkholderiales bacterium]MDE2453745.1 RidA family protein [Burkholderiales bacterium]
MTRPKRSIHVPHIGHKAPIPLGARVGGLICSSAIAGKDPQTGALPADPAAQCRNAFANLGALLAAGGATLADVVRLTVTLADEALRDELNLHWLAAFPDPDDRPARHVAVQSLPHGLAVQLEVIALAAG